MMMRNETLATYPSQWEWRGSFGARGLRSHTYDAEVVVRFAQASEGMLFDAVRINSRSMFIKSDVLFEPGEMVQVTFPSPDGRPVTVLAEVAELDFGEVDAESAGMELEIMSMDAEDAAMMESMGF